MSTLGNLQINGRATQSLPAQNPNDLIRLGEALQLLRSQLAGSWSSVTTFTQGMLVSDDNEPDLYFPRLGKNQFDSL